MNIRPDAVQPLGENVEEKLHDTGLGRDVSRR